jgi:hypothetical protein
MIDQQLTSLKSLWAHVRPGGMYIIEDIETSYYDFFDPKGGDVGKPGECLSSAPAPLTPSPSRPSAPPLAPITCCFCTDLPQPCPPPLPCIGTFVDFLKRFVDVLNADFTRDCVKGKADVKWHIGMCTHSIMPGDETVASIHCFRNMCALQKKLGHEMRKHGCRHSGPPSFPSKHQCAV